MKILLAVDGSKCSLDAVQALVDHLGWYREAPQVELVTVHLPVPRLPGMGAAVGKNQLQKYYEEEGEKQLAAARRKLDAAGVPYTPRTLVGSVAETLVKHAKDTRCDLMYIGTRGHTELGNALVGSTATKVLHISDIPVLLVK
jgi:nucleotide-binding universal stress UspA family protein